MKDKLISIENVCSLHPIFRGRFGKPLAKLAMSIVGINRLNEVYDSSKMYEGVDFCTHVLDYIGVKLVVENKEVLNQFENKAFITVSNHAYGHIDGIAAIAIVGSVRPDFKMMVNFVLAIIDTMEPNFIAVNPFKSGKLSNKSSFDGVKQCITHLKEGHPLGFFPAGAVSKTKLEGLKMTVADREWQPSVIKLIKASKTPVIPMFFSGSNSTFFNLIDLISWRLRSFRLVREVSNKKGKTIHVRFGEPIMPDKIQLYNDLTDLASFLREKTYELKKE